MKKIYTLMMAALCAGSVMGQTLKVAGTTNTVGGVTCFYYDASDNLTYAIGALSNADGNTVNGCATWNGSSWSAVGDLSTVGTSTYVNDIIRVNDTLWAFGFGITLGGAYPGRAMAYWNGSAWVSTDYGIFGNSHFLTSINNTIYLGGNISGGMHKDSTIGGYEGLGDMAYWNGHKFVEDTSYNSMCDSPNDVILYNGKIYANEKVFDGTSWSDWGIDIANCSAEIKRMYVHNGKLYVSVENSTNNYILQYDGTTIDTIANNISANVTDMASMGTDLVACGNFNSFDGNSIDEVAIWDGANWTGISDLLGGNVNTLGNFNGQLLLSTIEGHPIYSAATTTNVGSVATFGDPQTNRLPVVTDYDYAVFPNPNKGIFTLSGLAAGTQVSVYNVLGDKLSEVRVNNALEQVSLENAPAGVYFLRIQDGENIRTEKIVVE